MASELKELNYAAVERLTTLIESNVFLFLRDLRGFVASEFFEESTLLRDVNRVVLPLRSEI
jgi:hypothetical protein